MYCSASGYNRKIERCTGFAHCAPMRGQQPLSCGFYISFSKVCEETNWS